MKKQSDLTYLAISVLVIVQYYYTLLKGLVKLLENTLTISQHASQRHWFPSQTNNHGSLRHHAVATMLSSSGKNWPLIGLWRLMTSVNLFIYVVIFSRDCNTFRDIYSQTCWTDLFPSSFFNVLSCFAIIKSVAQQ